MRILSGYVLCLCLSLSLQQKDGENKAVEESIEGSGQSEEVTDIENVELLEPDFELKVEEAENKLENEDDTVEVKTFLGRVKGKKTTLATGEEIHKFLGIPYAKPPVGDLRFMPPQIVTRYNDQECFNFGAECPQLPFDKPGSEEIKGSEDCLFLNVYTMPNAENTTNLKPVMVWIHGGGFTLGSAQLYDPTPLVKEGVVVVTLNYRLAGLGFLTFGNDIVSGNMGLRDQIEALKWTKRFIYYFGGDPSKITIFGESAGAISVNAIQMSPMSVGLISGTIAQSGTAFLGVMNEKSQPQGISVSIATRFNCTSTRKDSAMLKCLQKIPVSDFILRTQSSLQAKSKDDIELNWAPVQDSYSSDPVIPMEPLAAFNSGEFIKVPMMTGTVKNDGALLVPEDNFEAIWKLKGPQLLNIAENQNYSVTNPEENTLANIFLKYYTGGSFNTFEVLNEVVDMLTDSWFLSPDQKLSELGSKFTQVYNYQLTYAATNTFLSFYSAGRNLTQEQFKQLSSLKPVHADDVLHLFNVFGVRSEEDEKMSSIMVKYWTNFAKYGHPSPFLRQNITTWKHYSGDKRYMELSLKPTLKQNIEEERMTFWQKMVWNERESKLGDSSLMRRIIDAVLHGLRIK